MPSLIDIVVTLVLAVILGGALLFIHKEKKRGVKCIGCPDAVVCAKRRSGEACGSTDNK